MSDTGCFFNQASPENVSRLAPPKNASTGPRYFEKVLSMAAERGEIPNTLTFSIPRGGQSGTLTLFLKSVIYRPALNKFRGGPAKKTTLYIVKISEMLGNIEM